jgi:hypothetical protein
MIYELILFLPSTIIPLSLLIWLSKIWLDMIKETRKLAETLKK